MHRPTTVLTLALIALVSSAACNRIDGAPAAPNAASASAPASPAAAESDEDELAKRPADSDVVSLGAGEDTRVYYQYIDSRGGVRFAERLDDVPEAWRDKVGYLELDAPPPMSPADAQRVRDERYARANPGGTRLASAGGSTGSAMDRFEPGVILYYADWCGYCKKAKRHLDRAGVAYELRDVDNPHIAKELAAKTGGRGIPVLDVDGRIMKGYSAASYDQLLDSI